MTYRERRERRADRLRGWAETRQVRAAAVFKAGEPFTSDIAFNTQPGHIPFRARLIAREDRAHESLQKAARMESRADGIESQLDSSIYSDDPDAIDRLTERIAELEAQRERIKTRNAAYRKEHGAELKGLSVYAREQKLPHAGYELSNLSGNISRQRARLDLLRKRAAGLDPRYTKVAMVRRKDDAPLGMAAPLYLNCQCGAMPPTALDGPDVTCACGAVYTYNGWRRSA
jgi:hypothetical protein